MAEQLLIAATATLFGWSLALAGFTIAMRAWGARRQRRWQRAEDVWRGPVEAFILDGSPLPPVPRAEREVALELLLRYQALLRGDEAQRIVAYLEAEGYVERAVRRLGDRNRWRRAEAAGQLGRMRSGQAVPALIVALHDRSEDVRTAAARSLAASGHPEAVAALAAALGDRSRWTASAVAADLVEMGSFAVPTLLEIDAGRAHDAAVSAVRVLGELRDGRAAAPLAEILRSSADLNMRAQAACALGKIGSLQAAERLKSALRDRAWQVRAQAATALGALGDPRSVASVAAAIEDESWWVRRNCAEALGRLGTQGRQALLRLSASPDRYVRERCLAVLEELDAQAADRQAPQGLP